MPVTEAPCVELGSAPRSSSTIPSPSPSEISSASSVEPHQVVRATPLFRVLAQLPPEPVQPSGQDELERRIPGYRRIVIPRDLTLIELLKQCSGVTTDDEVLQIREAKLRVIAERVGLRRLHILAPRLRSLTLDGSAVSTLRDLGIGLVHLKILSVNRCGLTSLDGVWGLPALKELYATGNHLTELNPLAALQKLHTLNLADNPELSVSRLWMVGVCSSLRQLTLTGTSAYEDPEYRCKISAILPMLIYLDDQPLHEDFQDDTEGLFDDVSSSDGEADTHAMKTPPIYLNDTFDDPFVEPQPGPSQIKLTSEHQDPRSHLSHLSRHQTITSRLRRRPATSECAGVRPNRPDLPRRPKTASDWPTIDAPTRLVIMNTLMGEGWRSCGSKLTSGVPVCGNLALALRRSRVSSAANRITTPDIKEIQEVKVEENIVKTARDCAKEIPMAMKLEDWVKFKEETGIDINIDFSKFPNGVDALSAIERLERIEKETSERLSEDNNQPTISLGETSLAMMDYDHWRRVDFDIIPSDIDSNASSVRDEYVYEYNISSDENLIA